MSDREEVAVANERGEVGVGWWLLSVLAAFVLGWWLAIRTLTIQAGQAVAAVAAIPAGDPRAKRLLPEAELKKRADDYLTVKELERYLPLCGKAIREEIASGKLPSIWVRKKLTVKGSDALAWLLARKEGGFNAKNA